MSTPIAILSDSHDDLESVGRAAEILRRLEIDRVIHCGDVTGPAVVDLLAPFTVQYVVGNCDQDVAGLTHAAESVGHRFEGVSGRLETPGGVIGFTHGHLPGTLEDLIAGGCRWVAHGHTHQTRDERVGSARVLNPGALYRARPRTLLVLDPATGEVQWIEV